MFVQMWLGERLKSKLKRHSGRDNGLTYVFPRQVSIHKGLAQVILVCRKKSDPISTRRPRVQGFLAQSELKAQLSACHDPDDLSLIHSSNDDSQVPMTDDQGANQLARR